MTSWAGATAASSRLRAQTLSKWPFASPRLCGNVLSQPSSSGPSTGEIGAMYMCREPCVPGVFEPSSFKPIISTRHGPPRLHVSL
jgi:hypothetical protein